MQAGFLTPGLIIAQRFKVEDHVSTGGMGTVFRARDLTTGDLVAIKLILHNVAKQQEEERFMREAQVLSELRHPGIVSYVAHGHTADGQPFLAMEWLDGIDLSQRLQRGSLSLPECVTLLHTIAEALAVAHRRGIVHRDLKPSNIFLRGGLIERVALLDFGIAHQVFSSGAMTRTGIVIGTPEYMAPEQARGQRDIGPSADIFSLGCVIYECLTGQPPFVGAHMAAQLAKILFEEARPVRQLRGAVPEQFDALLMRMLAKSPEQRPADAGVLLNELSALQGLTLETDSVPRSTSGKSRSSLAGGEQQLVSVVVGALRRSLNHGMDTIGWEDAEQFSMVSTRLTTALLPYGVHCEWLANGSMVATLTNAGHATDQAAQAARFALALQERWPESVVALATGRGVLHQTLPVGEAIDRAVDLLRARATLPPQGAEGGASEGVWLDDVTAGLLDGRFQLSHIGEYAVLPGERISAGQTRLLLGKPTPCVGREQELAVLDVVLAGCVNDSIARIVLVTAPPGMGKSRLRHEFLRRLETRGDEITVMIGRGDPMTTGSPYVLLSDALRRECGMQTGEETELKRSKLCARLGRHLQPSEAPRIIEFLGELCQVPFSDSDSVLLRAARQDPKIMSDQVKQAFVDFLRAECETKPLLLILEDLHWGDPLTVKLIDIALRDLADQPLMVLALARPEAYKLFPALWAERGLQELRLTALNKKASERLVRQVLGKDIAPATLNRIIEQSAGNALFLEELIRAIAEGKGDELPKTVLAMVQARLQRLDPAARRVLRAASIFGETFWKGGLLMLSVSHTQATQTSNTEEEEIAAWLEVLVEAEAIERHRESRFPQEKEYGFRHALLREAAYSMLTEEDRRLGHQLAGQYLEAMGERDPMVLAEHFRCAGDDAHAIPNYLRAADQSYDSNDLEGARKRAERGVSCGASGETLGSLRVLQMLVHVWRTEWDTGYVLGNEALALLPPGSYRWCKAVGHMLGISAMISQPDPAAIGALVQSFVSTTPSDDARGAYIEAASIVLAVFSWGGQRDAARYLKARMEEIGSPLLEHDATTRGWLSFSHCWFVYMMEPMPWKAVQLAREASRSFKQAGDVRNQIFAQSLLGRTLFDLGCLSEGEENLRASLVQAEKLGEAFPIATAKIYMAPMLLQGPDRGKLVEARTLAEAMLGSRDLNAAYRGLACNVLARLRLMEGHTDKAAAHAEQAQATLASAPMWLTETLELLIRVGLQRGDAKAAVTVAEQARTLLQSVGSTGHSELPLRLAIVEAYQANGDEAAARIELKAAISQLELRAADIPGAADRQRYLAQAPASAQVLALAKSWGILAN